MVKEASAPSHISALDELERLILLRGQTLGFAESCTGGLVSSLLTERPGVSRYFLGSVVSYSGHVKHKVLSVPQTLLWSQGEVSFAIARSMAHGAKVCLDCDWALSVTGVAGPSGGSVEVPVGTVFMACVGPGFERVVQKQFVGPSRQDIQRQAALFAFEFLLSAMR